MKQSPAGALWNPVFLQALLSVVGFVIIGLAVLGQTRRQATLELEALSKTRAERIAMLETEMVRIRAETAKETEFLNIRIRTLEGQVAELQKMNLELQRANARRTRKEQAET